MSWNIVKLGNEINILSGYAFDSKRFDNTNGTPLVRIRDINRGYTETYFSGLFDETFVINNGDILIGMDGEFNATRWSGGKALLNQRVCKVSVSNHHILDERFLLYFLPQQLKKIEDKTPFVTVKHLSVKDIRNIDIPLPPLHVQNQIADILDKADALRKKDQELLQKYDELAQAIFIDMFGDPVKNEKGWKKMSLGDMAADHNGSIRTGPFGSQLLLEELQDKGIPVYGIDNVQTSGFVWAKPKFITESKFEELKGFSILKSDVLITRTGTVGRSCVAPFEIPKSIIGPNLLRVTLNQKLLLPEVLSFLLNNFTSIKDKIKSLSPGATVAVFNSSNLKELQLCALPITMQRKFVDSLRNIEKQKSLIKHNHFSEELFQSLLHQTFH